MAGAGGLHADHTCGSERALLRLAEALTAASTERAVAG
jgi:hypothetical protein